MHLPVVSTKEQEQKEEFRDFVRDHQGRFCFQTQANQRAEHMARQNSLTLGRDEVSMAFRNHIYIEICADELQVPHQARFAREDAHHCLDLLYGRKWAMETQSKGIHIEPAYYFRNDVIPNGERIFDEEQNWYCRLLTDERNPKYPRSPYACLSTMNELTTAVNPNLVHVLYPDLDDAPPDGAVATQCAKRALSTSLKASKATTALVGAGLAATAITAVQSMVAAAITVASVDPIYCTKPDAPYQIGRTYSLWFSFCRHE